MKWSNYSQSTSTDDLALDMLQRRHHSVTKHKGLGKSARFSFRLATWACGAVFAVFACQKAVTWAFGVVFAAFLTTMAFGQKASTPILPVTTKMDVEITSVADTYRKAVLDADAATLVALYRDDAIEMPFSHPPITGRPAIRQFYEDQFKSPARVTAFSFTPAEATVRGDIAYTVGSYKRSMTAPSGPIEVSGSYVVILKRTDRQWKVAYATYTCDCPPSSGTSPATR